MLKVLATSGSMVLVLLLLGACSSKSDKLKTKQSSLYFGAGTQSLMDKQYTEALTSLLKANEMAPDNSEILNNLGMAYYFKDETDLAIRYLNQSIKLNPKNSDARVNLASIEYQRGNISGAEQLLKQVLRDLTYDKQARTYYNLGILEFEKRKNLAGAQQYFLRSIKEDENFCPSYFQMGMIHFTTRRWSDAGKKFKEASMGVCYENPAAHYYQALSLIELKRFTDARIKLDEVESRFGKTEYAASARKKVRELNQMGFIDKTGDVQASRKMLSSPSF